MTNKEQIKVDMINRKNFIQAEAGPAPSLSAALIQHKIYIEWLEQKLIDMADMTDTDVAFSADVKACDDYIISAQLKEIVNLSGIISEMVKDSDETIVNMVKVIKEKAYIIEDLKDQLDVVQSEFEFNTEKLLSTRKDNEYDEN